jgi:hypothetical protein
MRHSFFEFNTRMLPYKNFDLVVVVVVIIIIIIIIITNT